MRTASLGVERPASIPPEADVLGPQPGPQTHFLSTPARIAIYGGARGGGKRLRLDEPVPTPEGWTTVGALRPGDRLFDECGEVCRVLATHPIEENPVAYRLSFDDGNSVECDAEHLWLTLDNRDRKEGARRTGEFRSARRAKRARRVSGRKSTRFSASLAVRNATRVYNYLPPPSGKVRTTAEIAATLRVGTRGEVNHAIPVAGALQLPARDLPLDPYVLGLWLGDGASAGCVISTADPEIVEAFRSAGFVVRHRSRYDYGVRGLVTVLRPLGVVGNKHVPGEYLRASVAQRLALLQGLMDTDGTVARSSGSAEFCTTSAALARDVEELIVSLGYRAKARPSLAKLNGRVIGPKWTIKWVSADYVFRLDRKRQLQRIAKSPVTRLRYVVACEPALPSPMRCLTVDSLSGLFLVGRAMIPTHNTFAVLLEPVRHLAVLGFNAVVFRRTRPEIMQPDGLWDTSRKLYPGLGGRDRETLLDWRFASGSTVRFAHLEHEKNLESWLGAQIALLAFDQLEAFTEKEFFTLLACNRSTCGVRPYVRGTCNPDPDCFLAKFLAWWIDQGEKLPDGKPNPRYGYAIEERSGVIRWMLRLGDELHWFDSEAEALDEVGRRGLDPREIPPISVTFIRSLVDDNPALIEVDAEYVGMLNALPLVERERFRKGNWKIRPSAGTVFQRGWFPVVPVAPTFGVRRRVRYWDRAATEVSPSNPDPDWTVGARVALLSSGLFVVEHVERFRRGPAHVEAAIQNLGRQEKALGCAVGLERDPAQAGKAEALYLVRGLKGLHVIVVPASGSKLTRALPTSAQAEQGNVVLVEGPWNEAVLATLEAFDGSEKGHDDDVDAISGAIATLCDDELWHERPDGDTGLTI
ncbi:MAG: phage terminase large subunit [Actinobacteria bacterium]|nr:phage terminase large subunit [Actinomycetota bacterium]